MHKRPCIVVPNNLPGAPATPCNFTWIMINSDFVGSRAADMLVSRAAREPSIIAHGPLILVSRDPVSPVGRSFRLVKNGRQGLRRACARIRGPYDEETTLVDRFFEQASRFRVRAASGKTRTATGISFYSRDARSRNRRMFNQ